MSAAAGAQWPTARLGDVITAKYGKALPHRSRRRGAVPVYGSNGVVGHHDDAVTTGPAIVIGRKGSSGAINMSATACWPIDTTYYVDEPGPFSLDFLGLLLSTLGLEELDRSTAIPGLNREQLYDIEVPVPPMQTQVELVGLISDVTRLDESASAHLAAAKRAVERFRQSVLAAACSGQLTADWSAGGESESAVSAIGRKRIGDRQRLGRRYSEPFVPNREELPPIPESWCWVALPEVGEMGRGKSKHRPRNDPKLYGGDYPFVQTGDVARSGGRVTTHTQSYNDAGLAQSRLWPERTVCITIAANIAESALLTYPACFPDSVVGIVADESVALPEYVELFVRTARRDLAAFAPATAQANINLAILGTVALALPSVDEQREIVRRVDALYSLADDVVGRIDTAAHRIDRTSQAVLAKAFRGDLIADGEV